MHQRLTAQSLDSASRLACGAAAHEYNLVQDADSYKFSHAGAYPGGMTRALSYVEDRVGAKFPASIVFGLQYYLKRYYAGPVVTPEKIDAAERRMRWHGEPFARGRWDHIVSAHGGRLPIRIRAVPEGTLVPVGNALRTVEATCPDCAWLPSFLETGMLRDWAPRAVATQGFHAKLLIAEGLAKSSDNAAACLPFALHDFGSRGTTCPEQAGICGLAHLVNWMGTDTCEALEYAEAFYGATGGTAYSVPALEHSTVLAWGKGRSLDEALERQALCFTRAATQWAEAGYKIGSFIADTYDVRRTIREQLCGTLYGLVKYLHAEHGFRFVARLDSGHPISEMVVRSLGDFEAALPKGEIAVNSKGYKVLPDYFRILQGDGVSIETIQDIEHAVVAAGWSTECIATRGMGGRNLHSGVNRDMQRTAQKPSIVQVCGAWLDVSKNPVDDPDKASKAGWLDLVRLPDGSFRTVAVEPGTTHPDSALVTVFEDGVVSREWTLDEIRARAEEAFRAAGTYYPLSGSR